MTRELKNSIISTSTSSCLYDFDIFLFMSLNFRVNLEFIFPKKNRLSWQIEILVKRRSYGLIVRNPFR